MVEIRCTVILKVLFIWKKNHVFHTRTKHIGMRYHFIPSVLENGVLKLEKIPGDRNPTDMFMKVVNKEKLKGRFSSWNNLKRPLHNNLKGML
ncbi:hypothetical protein LIER_10414 [Lithospermum erythrorhizon]|uniref:Copia protein n=1 Tax=Lithospermum erythrorhizon TaxID=34254 RepID=A0AAV3PJC1_LITER